jgi:hypothetical protein
MQYAVLQFYSFNMQYSVFGIRIRIYAVFGIRIRIGISMQYSVFGIRYSNLQFYSYSFNMLQLHVNMQFGIPMQLIY